MVLYMRKALLYTLLFIFCAGIIRAQRSVLSDEAVSRTLYEIYQLDEKAYLQELANVDNAAMASFLREYWHLLVYAAENKPSGYDAYMKASDDALSKVSKHKYADNLRANLLLHRCLVEMSCGNMIASGIQFYKSFKAFRTGEKKYHDYEGQMMLRGIFNIILSQVPEKWKSLAGFFFDRGDLQQGFVQINDYRTLMLNVPGAYEESLLLSFANLFLSHEQRLDDDLAQKMRGSTSPAVLYVYVLSNGRKQKGKQADEVLNSMPAKYFEQYPLLIHQLSKYALRRLEPEECIKQADRFLERYQGVACKNDAYLMKAYAYALMGDSQKRKEQAELCVKMTAGGDIDERTHNEAKRIIDRLDVTLLRARLRFEYGAYDECREMLKNYTPDKRDEIEYSFRMARCNETLGYTQDAIRFYNHTIELGLNDDQYYAPYAAIYMADLAIKANNKAEAKRLLLQAKELNNGEHSKEIDQRIAVTMRKIED